MEQTQDIWVETWDDLVEQLYAGSWQADIQRHRSPYAFRGLQDSGTGLETSLQRLGGDYAEMERHLLRNFRKYAGRNVVESDSVWYWLSLAKHHGLPNRLLDWSFSPFVALHFATQDPRNYACDGAIWMVDYTEVHAHLPEKLRLELKNEGANVLTADMLGSSARSMQEFDRLSREPFVVFFEPPSINERIINQFALFSILSSPQVHMDAWLAERPGLQRRVIIPGSMKWEIRDKLDQANITERVLFPGLDGLTAWLKRQYSPRS